ncbi:MAG: molybdopterin-guanine dinucleotide biosynthesis protein B [bacterium]|jgi:molybdopterin-guanine dinucleotide biosynthesis protein B
MRVFAVCGVSKTGKTTTIEKIISELRRRRYTVGSLKDIHFEQFAIDTAGTNTCRHREAGSQLVTARGLYETDILFPTQLPVEQILRFYDHDFVVLEGVDDYNCPKIVTARTPAEIDARWDATVMAIAGVIANERREYAGLPVFNALNDIGRLVDFIETKVDRVLPNVPAECCGLCGSSCPEMLAAILRGEKKREDCCLDGREKEVELRVDGEPVPMVPFVQDIIRGTVGGLLATLKGYKRHAKIEIIIQPK